MRALDILDGALARIAAALESLDHALRETGRAADEPAGAFARFGRGPTKFGRAVNKRVGARPESVAAFMSRRRRSERRVGAVMKRGEAVERWVGATTKGRGAVIWSARAGGWRLKAEVPLEVPAVSDVEEQFLPVVEDAATRRIALAMQYVSGSTGKVAQRHASVHYVELGAHPRFIAVCHRAGTLRRFRVDGIVRAHLDASTPFRDVAPQAVAAFRAESLDGFKGEGAPIARSFLVFDPAARWVLSNLLSGMRAESLHEGIRVSVETTGMSRLASFVVGLGAAARPETPELARAVAELAAHGEDDSSRRRRRSPSGGSAAVQGARGLRPAPPLPPARPVAVVTNPGAYARTGPKSVPPRPFPPKLNFVLAEEVRRLRRAGRSVTNIAARYGVAKPSISAVLK